MTSTTTTERAAAGYPPARQAWATVFLLFLFYIISLLDRNIITLFADNIRGDLGLTDVQLSLLFGPAFALSYAVGALPFGWAMDRFSRRTVLWSGVTIWSLGTIACGLSHGFVQLFSSRAFVGAGEAVLVPGNQSILADQFPPERLAFPISIYSMGARLGQGASLLIGGLLATLIAPSALLLLPLIGEIRGWQVIFLVVGIPGLLIAPLIFLIPEPARRSAGKVAAAGVTFRAYLKHAFKNLRFFGGLHLGAMVVIVVVTALASWTPAFFQRHHHWPVEQVGLWLGIVVMVGPVIGTPLHGFLADWLFRRNIRDGHMRYMVFAILLATVPLVAGYTVANPWISLACLTVGQGLLVCTTVLMPTTLQLMAPGEMRGKAASFLLLATAIGGVSIGPAIAAMISEHILKDSTLIGLALAIMIALGLPLAAASFAVAMKPLALAHRRDAGVAGAK